jgi:hypothetical protein
MPAKKDYVLIDGIEHKECSRCHKFYPASTKYFTKQLDKLTAACKFCTNKKQKIEIKDGYKLCCMCKNELPATCEYFDKSSKGKFGLDSRCKSCKREYRNKNIGRFKALQKERYIQNRDNEIANRKIYYQNNKEVIRQKSREYHQKNKDIIRKQHHEYWNRTKELRKIATKKRINNNIELYKQIDRNIHHRRRSKMKQVKSFLSVNDWTNIKWCFNNECAYCGECVELTQEHFIPVSKNGEYSKNNIIPACQYCNSSKNDSDFFTWYPKQQFYSKKREVKILKYLHYDPKTKYQQIAL